jgi:sugar lactone lactonase YvrE
MVSHLAGPLGGPGNVDGVGAAARFDTPIGITRVGTNLYVADTFNNLIRKIEISTGRVTTFAGLPGIEGYMDGPRDVALFSYPRGITTDGTDLYLTDSSNHLIRKITIATGVVSTLAGYAGFAGSDDGSGSDARFNYPDGVTCDGDNLYIADMQNHTIRKLVISSGTVSTIAGSFGVQGSMDATGTDASFSAPMGITTDGTNLYVAEWGNSTIRCIALSSNIVTTLAGIAGNSGSDDGIGAAARFCCPTGITIEGAYLYVSDCVNDTIRRIEIATGTVTTIAGTSGQSGSVDGYGTGALFSYMSGGLASDGSSLYISDGVTIRKLNYLSREVSTLAGMAPYGDGLGSFYMPFGITAYGHYLYIADQGTCTIKKIDSRTGIVSTIAGSSQFMGSMDGIGTDALFYSPCGITTDGACLYVADTFGNKIRKVHISTGEVSTIAGNSGTAGNQDGPGVTATFNAPFGITTDGTNLYVADTLNHSIRKIVLTSGMVSTFAGDGISFGHQDGTGDSARLYRPYGITTDGVYLFVADTYNELIRRIEIATATVTTIAGSAGSKGSQDGTGSAARFNDPFGVAIDGINLYVADSRNHTIRKIVLDTCVVTTLAGTPGHTSSVDGSGSEALFNMPLGIVCFGANLFVTDSNNNAVRKISLND